uniref:CCHC-type domain-containing protein n=1 Tax=Ananas comosus var. bracteatus TaxID=296719 RepID=A0A6V7QG91_ANACO|nr:unnamed protein product [Ananas comosus var. bracteatus]
MQEVGEPSRGGKEVRSLAPLACSALRRCEVGEGLSDRKGASCQAPLRSPVSRSFEVGESSRGGKGAGWQESLRRWGLLKVARSVEDEQVALPSFGKNVLCIQKESFNAEHQRSKLRTPVDEARGVVQCRVGDGVIKGSIPPSTTPPRGSYKEVLMNKMELHSPAPNPHKSNPHTPFFPRVISRHSLAKRCFRCLASDHFAKACRDPVRCFKCWKTGHRAYSCRGKLDTSEAAMERAANLRGRPPRSKVFVPYTEEYLRRVEMRRNAVLADVIRPANLGRDPITRIKTALASRFGGYVDDFAVARYRDRDFAIFLPEWVPADLLIRREIITLDDFWIRCWPWGQYRDARPHRVQFKAWIRLLNLSFEIWSVARVAALISSFGRFIRADAATKAMTDLRAYRCQIALDSIYNIPQNLSVIVGEELFPVMVHLERWERAEEGGVEAPPAPPRNDHDGAEAQVGGDLGGGGENPEDENMEDAPGELEEAEPTHSTRRSSGGTMARLVPTAAHQVGAAARPRAAVGRRLWVPTSRGGSGIETTIARVTRKAEGGRSLEVYVSSERRQRGSPARCLTPPSSFQVKPALLPQGLPREEDDPTLGIGEPEVFKASSQTLGFIYSLVFGPTLITLTIWMAPAWEGALGPGPVTNGLYTGARDIGSYSVGFGSRPMLGVVFIWAGGIGPLLVGQRNGPPRGLRIWTGSVSPCRALRSEFPVPEAHGSRIESIYKRLPKDASFLTTVRGMAGRKACDRDPSSWTGGAEIAAQGAASTSRLIL